MEKKEFVSIRKYLEKTQKEMSQLLGTSLRAVKSFEQGWRNVPVYVERQALFLVSLKKEPTKKNRPCWTIKKCPMKTREKCPAWEFHAGHVCWFISGTLCQGDVQKNWHEKMRLCRKCDVFSYILS